MVSEWWTGKLAELVILGPSFDDFHIAIHSHFKSRRTQTAPRSQTSLIEEIAEPENDGPLFDGTI